MDTVALHYSHTQKAPLCLLLYGSALACFALAGMVGIAPGSITGITVGLLIALLPPREMSSDLHPRPDAYHCACRRWQSPDCAGGLGAASSW
jgi:hypothetical protein